MKWFDIPKGNKHKNILSTSYITINISAEIKKYIENKKDLLLNHIQNIKDEFVSMYEMKKNRAQEYTESLVLVGRETGKVRTIDYKVLEQRKNSEMKNYKNSYIKFAYEAIPNAMPIFFTTTLPSYLHPFDDKGRMHDDYINKKKVNKVFDYKIYRGYVLLEKFMRNFYKQAVFKTLTSGKRARVSTFEGTKNWVAHIHVLEIIDGSYILQYINALVRQHKNSKVGRTEIVVLSSVLKIIKKQYTLVRSKNHDDQYYIKGIHVYFKVLQTNSSNIVSSISEYATKTLEGNESIYHAWALYIASLKDKYNPKDEVDGTRKLHKKIRRIRYSKLLISKALYNKIFVKKLVDLLKENKSFQKQNMYYEITKMLMNEDLKIYSIYPEKNGKAEIKQLQYIKVDYLNNQILIDCRANKIFRSTTHMEAGIELYTQVSKIDLKKDKWRYIRYRFKNDTKTLFDITSDSLSSDQCLEWTLINEAEQYSCA